MAPHIVCVDLEPYYKVRIDRDTGDVCIRSYSPHKKGKKLSVWINSCGYLTTKINQRHILIHHIVAEAFLGKRPDGLVINHKDSNRQNNSPDNLEYVTQAENVRHAIDAGRHVAVNPTKHRNYKDGRCVGKENRKRYKKLWRRENYRRLNNVSPNNYRV